MSQQQAARGLWPGPARSCSPPRLWEAAFLAASLSLKVSGEWKRRQTLSLWKTSARDQRQLFSLGKCFCYLGLAPCVHFPGFDPATFLTHLKLCSQCVVSATGSFHFLENTPMQRLCTIQVGVAGQKLMCCHLTC